MDPVPNSHYFYANKLGLIMLDALEDTMGKNGVNTILELSHLPHLVDNHPPDNLECGFDFANISAINQALEENYGSPGGRGIALRVGRATFSGFLRNFGTIAGVDRVAFKVLPLQSKLRIGLPSIAHIFSQITDQSTTVEEQGQNFVYKIHRCPYCWGRTNLDEPVCFMGVGLIQESLKWFSGGEEFQVYESKCMAMGDKVCEYTILQTESA